MNKKKIIIIASIGLVCFALSFAGAFFLLPAKAEVAQATEADAAADSLVKGSEQKNQAMEPALPQTAKTAGMAERQLKELACDLREKMTEYETKLKSVEVERQRLDIARGQLEQDIEKLDTLRAELAASINSLKNERDKLQKTRIEIGELEKKNLITIAASYDKMDSSSAGKILANMAQGQNGSINDAVKILFYMGDRNKAKVLASLADNEPALAAYLSQKLKTLNEVR